MTRVRDSLFGERTEDEDAPSASLRAGWTRTIEDRSRLTDIRGHTRRVAWMELVPRHALSCDAFGVTWPMLGGMSASTLPSAQARPPRTIGLRSLPAHTSSRWAIDVK